MFGTGLAKCWNGSLKNRPRTGRILRMNLRRYLPAVAPALAVAFLTAQSRGFAQTVKRAIPAKPAAVPASALADANSGSATFRPGDSFEMSLGGIPAEYIFQKTFTVGADGMINVPYAGLIRAAGVTQSQFEKTVEKQLIEAKIYRWPTITIQMPERPRLITFGGQVRQTQGVSQQQPARENPKLYYLPCLDAPGPAYRALRRDPPRAAPRVFQMNSSKFVY